MPLAACAQLSVNEKGNSLRKRLPKLLCDHISRTVPHLCSPHPSAATPCIQELRRLLVCTNLHEWWLLIQPGYSHLYESHSYFAAAIASTRKPSSGYSACRCTDNVYLEFEEGFCRVRPSLAFDLALFRLLMKS
jgi:hypothetical protein